LRVHPFDQRRGRRPVRRDRGYDVGIDEVHVSEIGLAQLGPIARRQIPCPQGIRHQ
jgi:hypothetical protein